MSTALPIERDDRVRALDATPGQTVFTFDAVLWAVEDLQVAKRIAPSTAYVVIAGGFTVVLGSESAVVTFATAPRPTSGDPVVTVRLTSRAIYDRHSDVTRGGTISGALLEREFDRMATTLQELRRDADTTELDVLDLTARIDACAEAVGLSSGDLGLANWRMRRALSTLGVFWTIDATIPADPSSSLAIAWTGPLRRNGILWTHISTTLGWGDAEWVSFLALALSMDA